MMTRPYLSILTVIIALTFLCITASADAQSLFESHDILEVRIEAPLKTLMRVRSDTDYLDGTLSYSDEAGETRSFDLKLRARGRYRRQKKTCNFPPVRLNFRKRQVAGTEFDGQDKLKLVTHCQNKRARNEQLVLREYLAYRILQTLTDKSFGARLLRVTWIDSDGGDEPMTKYGFIIEDDDAVAERIGLTSLDTRRLSYRDLDARHTLLVNLFQYLIGNTDFSLIRGPADDNCCHNSVPFSDGNIVSPVPYDFDFSGLVDAPYAAPNPQFDIRSVRTRVYRGRCSNNVLLPETIAYFLGKQAEIFSLLDGLVDLDRKNRQDVVRYLNLFYEEISDEEKVRRKIVKECS